MEQPSVRVRIVVVAVLAALWAAAVVSRLSQLQFFRYTEYLARAERQQQRLLEITPRRGPIYDRNLRELAMSVAVDSCFAVPGEIADPDLAARLLAGVLDTSAEEIRTRLSSSRNFVWIARKLSAEQAERIQALNLRGIYFQKENRRFYPKRNLAAHVLGYVDLDEKGLAGIEYAFDSEVRGRPGRMMILADARRRWYDRNEQAATPGTGVVLTLDEKIQYIAEKELAAAIAETRAESGSIVVQDPSTGELLAVANWPTFNPNAPAESPADDRMNRAVAALYEPGSTLKILTVAAALEEGLTRPEEVIDCQMGVIYISGHRIRDHKPFGLLSVAEILHHSSDVGAIKLGLRLGAPRFHSYLKAFGLGQPTGIELPGESRGLLRGVQNWTPGSVGSISMGQEIGVTGVQLVSLVSAIANEGWLHRPRIVRELRKGGRVIPAPFTPPRRVLSAQTAVTMKRILEGVVLTGTGKLARLDGWTSAGKTGTAQKIDPATGRYSLTDHIASYVGFAPLNNPAVTVLVTLDSPRGRYHGGEVAAPLFKRVAAQVLAYLNVPHDVVVDAPALQRASGRKPPKAEPLPDVRDFAPAQMEPMRAGALAASESPESAAAEGPVTVALEEGAGVPVPRFAGLSVRRVTEECFRLGLNPVLIGTGVALEQSPEPGLRVRRGSRVTVRFGRSAAASGGGN
jgi:cell division protein FtsI (penicillin-binding protein 3)